MAEKTLLDIQNENFDAFFIKEAKEISANGREILERDISYRLFKSGVRLSEKKAVGLSFLGKIYVLWKALKKRIWIIVEDEQNGVTPGQFIEIQKAARKRNYTIDAVPGISQGMFVLGNRELCDAFAYLNLRNNTGAYNYLTKAKNQPVNPTTEYNSRNDYIARFLFFYEAHKKQWVNDLKLTVPEYYVLLYAYNKVEFLGADLYNRELKRAYQSSTAKIKIAFGVLQSKGYLRKTGEGRGAKMQITPLGRDIVSGIFHKYALNC